MHCRSPHGSTRECCRRGDDAVVRHVHAAVRAVGTPFGEGQHALPDYGLGPISLTVTSAAVVVGLLLTAYALRPDADRLGPGRLPGSDRRERHAVRHHRADHGTR